MNILERGADLEKVRNLLISNGELRKLYRDANVHEEVKKITHHGWIHIVIVWALGQAILRSLTHALKRKLGGCQDCGLIAEIAFLLHDCGLVEGRKSHAKNGACKARELLERLEVNPLAIQIICCLVRWHRVEDFLVMAKTIWPQQEHILSRLRAGESIDRVIGYVDSSEPFEAQDVIDFLALAELGIPMLILLALVVLADVPDIGFTRVRGKSIRKLEPCRQEALRNWLKAQELQRNAKALVSQAKSSCPRIPLAVPVGATRYEVGEMRRQRRLAEREQRRRLKSLHNMARDERQIAAALRGRTLDEVMRRDRIEISDHDRADFSILRTTVRIESAKGVRLMEALVQCAKRNPETGELLELRHPQTGGLLKGQQKALQNGKYGLFGHAFLADEAGDADGEGYRHVLLEAIASPLPAIKFLIGDSPPPATITLTCNCDPCAASTDFIKSTKEGYFAGFKTAASILGLKSEVLVV